MCQAEGRCMTTSVDPRSQRQGPAHLATGFVLAHIQPRPPACPRQPHFVSQPLVRRPFWSSLSQGNRACFSLIPGVSKDPLWNCSSTPSLWLHSGDGEGGDRQGQLHQDHLLGHLGLGEQVTKPDPQSPPGSVEPGGEREHLSL